MVGGRSEMAAKRAFPKSKSNNVLGQRRKSAKMFRIDRNPPISNNDQQTLRDAESRHPPG